MRPFAALTFVALSLSSFVVATPLDGQIVLPNNEIAEEPRWKYTVCGDGETTVDIQSIEVYPDPPAPGKDLTVTVKARSTEIIEDGAYADVVVKLGRIKLLTKEIDLCEEARKANTSVQCPVTPGPYEVQQSVTLPKEIPRAKFDIHIDAWSFDGENYLFCLDLEADFRWRFPHRW
ncbi:Phosphatidylglycerol/phosphatidylinositol transfer protein [Leucoagaricus sp. SymC.cos]|nr:Phosphatidylglycerol/phosphatidylinositol transfer protein [Leucoagaricus sp. SymC.cos]